MCIVSRDGTLVLAPVSAVTAVGPFLGWAVANGLLGPSQRIALGRLVAAGLAVGGRRLRRRKRSFGASLLGLSLAITHVCAWGAGGTVEARGEIDWPDLARRCAAVLLTGAPHIRQKCASGVSADPQ